MRIIAGRLGGRHFDSPKGNRTHPMSDKMRGALFNALGDIEGLTFLDAFAGTGALGLEALSRGAAEVTLIEYDASAQHAISQNILELELKNQSNLFKASVSAWLKANPEILFDVVLCDPPYDDVRIQLLQALAAHTKLDGIVVLSLPPDAVAHFTADYQLLDTKSYGDGRLIFYRRLS